MSAKHDMSKDTKIAIIGAGIIGLSSALWLQRAGYKVTIIDRQKPGEGTSFGNAGVLANFSCLPFTRFKMLKKVPKMLMDKNSPLSISPDYALTMSPYAWHYFRSCFHYPKARHAMTQLQSKAFESDQVLLNMTGGNAFIRSQGCLAVFAEAESIEKARQGEMLERQKQGVNLSFCDANQIHDLEPRLAPFYAGGVYYPDARSTISPIQLSRCYADYFMANGGQIIEDQVRTINTTKDGVALQLSDTSQHFDHLVIAAGTASKELVQKLNVKIPLVSERGYHLMLKTENSTSLTRPVAWMDKSIFMSPIEDQIRIAGNAEFATMDAPPVQRRIDNLKKTAHAMLGDDIEVTSDWLGSRSATPDSLPMIGCLPNQPKVTLAFGHGHLGLTLSAVTGRLVSELVQGKKPCVNLAAFSPIRFS